MSEARNLINETAPNHDNYKSRLVDYNNDPTVIFTDLQKLLQLTEDRLMRQFADKPIAR